MCRLLRFVCPTWSRDSAPNIHLFRLSLPAQSIWHHSSVSKCSALLATQQIAAPNHCPHSLFPMPDSMDRMTLDGTDNLPHVSLCHQHFCGVLQNGSVNFLLVVNSKTLPEINYYLHSNFRIGNVTVNIRSGHSNGDAVQFDNARIRQECHIFVWHTLAALHVRRRWIHKRTVHILTR